MTWTLRRRLVAVVTVLLAVVATLIGVVSTLLLHANLEAQLDQRVSGVSDRLLPGSGLGGGRRVGSHGGGSGGAVALPTTLPTTWPQPAPSPSGSSPTDLNRPGIELGLALAVAGSTGTTGSYVDDAGTLKPLTADQTRALLAVPVDGRLHTVQIAGLGSYRVRATTQQGGATSVVGLRTTDMDSIVDRFVLREVLISVLGLAVAALAAGWLVGRELRPLVRVAATATRVAELPLAKGEVEITERVDEADTDPRTEVGQVGAAVNRMLGHVAGALAARHESEQQVRQFVADASHELRTPLASIRGYAELVRRAPDELPGEARHALDRVEAETVRMTTLVSDMLLLARLDAGRPLASAPVDLTGLAVDAVADAHAAGPDHRWSLDLPGDGSDEDPTGPVEVVGDEDRLRQVLANLVSNARLHTPAGTHVTVGVRREGDRAVLWVHDDGPGIPEALQARLFQRFTRGDQSRNRAAGTSSTGLGMAIAQAVVQAHQGVIQVDSSPGDTTVQVRLPLADADDG